MYKMLLVWFGKLILAATRLRGNAGSALPGLVIEKLSPHFVPKMAKSLKDGCILVTGTNGKTTTTKIINGILRDAGKRVVTNRTGSNMSRGIASAMIEQANLFGRMRADVGLFEVDEAFAAEVAAKTRPRAIVVLNLLRDQLDRYGELDRTAELIGQSLEYTQNVILNGDDQLVAALAGHVHEAKTLFFGAAPRLRAQLPDDASLFDQVRQKWQELHQPDRALELELTKTRLTGEHQELTLRYHDQEYHTSLQLPGLYNAYNSAAALLAATTVKVSFSTALQSLHKIEPPFGRSETISVHGKTIQLLLVKNPAGFNQIIQTFLLTYSQLPVLMALNDNFADGRDVSWIWDVDFEPLHPRNHNILVTGIRANDLALRLKYAEVPATVERNPQKALDNFIHGLKDNQIGYVVPTYTAMLKLRALVGRKTDLKEIWQ